MISFKPLVSVVTITHNHEKYIKDTIHGIINQKCNFDIEFIISNDKSSDRTNETIQKTLDEIGLKKNINIRYFNHKKNKGVLDNFIWSLRQAKGKYIAYCEGDDYWTDPYKLQKQVDFLEANLGFGLSFTDCSILYEHSNKIEKSNKNLIHCDELSNTQLFNKIIKGDLQISTPTIVIRKKILDKHDFNSNKFIMGDMPLLLDYAMNCKFHYCQHDTTVYRNRINSASHPKDEIKKMRFKENAWEMKVYYSKKYANDIADWAQNQLNKHRIEMKAMFPKENIRLNNPILKHSLLFALIAVTPIKKYLLFRILRKVGLF